MILAGAFAIADERTDVSSSAALASNQKSLDDQRVVTRIEARLPKQPATWLEGWLLAKGEDGGCLVMEADGRLHALNASNCLREEVTDRPYKPLTLEEAAGPLLKSLPAGFKTTATKHFLVAYNTTDAYAKWNASLFERLYRGFYTYWETRGMKLQAPEYPLIAVIFDKRQDYLKYANREDVNNAESMIGYYNQLSNRIASYDLTGIEGMIPSGKVVDRIELVNSILRRPEAERSVATIVHEAVHQLAYNSGLQTRLADNPVAISEGLAMFFESPDLKSASGWSGIGNINRFNLILFRNSMMARSNFSTAKLIQDDACFQDPKLVSIAYGQSWALTYFLMRTKSKEFVSYMSELASRPPLEPTDPKRRIADFKRHFGVDLEKLDRDFLKYISGIKL